MTSPAPRVTVLYDAMRWEEKALMEAGRREGIDVRMVDCRGLAQELDGRDAADAASAHGVVLQRCVSYYRSVHSTAALEGLGATVINPMMTGVLAGNKLYAHMLLKKSGVPVPKARVAFSRDAALEALDRTGYPAVIKPTVGSWGRMVSRLTGRDAAAGVLEGREGMYPLYHVHYMEEFVDRPERDIRVIMVGGRAAAAIYRYSGSSWKTNMATGGRAEACPVTAEMEEICIKAALAVGGEVVGVDMMESRDRGHLVHEVNNTTEFKNTVRVCGVDVPAAIMRYAAGRARGKDGA